MSRPNNELKQVGVHGITRSAFLVRGALGIGAASGLAAVQPFVTAALGAEGLTLVGGPGSRGDLEALQFALTLEQLEAEFYRRALDQLSLSASTRELAELISENEDDHVDKIKAMIELLGGSPGKSPAFSFPLSDERAFLILAEQLEDLGVGAYNGAARGLRSMPVLETLAGIAQVEARHSAAIKRTQGKPPTEAFSEALDKETVEKQARKYTEAAK